jgi:hypothetical protein
MHVTSYWDDEIVQTTTEKAQETESSNENLTRSNPLEGSSPFLGTQ